MRSDYLESQQLCLTDGEGSTCVDREQLRALLNGSRAQSPAQTNEGSSADAYVDLNAGEDIGTEDDDAEVVDVDADGEDADDADLDLGDSATSTDNETAADTEESIASSAPLVLEELATSSPSAQ